MRIGILGTGTLAVGLGTAWTRAGHDILVGGRSPENAKAAAERIGSTARAVSPREAVDERDAVLLAVAWEGLADILHAAGAGDGSLAGIPVLDPTNAVEHGVGTLLTTDGRAIAEHVADWAPGAHVVKAFHLFPAAQWTESREPVTVAMAGDDPHALEVAAHLARDAGAHPAVIGPLHRARQLEEVAGFVIALAFAGQDPNAAIPHVPAAAATS
ncbi:NADPH-dependent F420 reductase [Actinospica sp.]|uniref:NADPH-dependent F420 reductase n=1 Tax=Actinospica sp. TaxID=1872142 RepID=UPI002C9410B0|nr:NAD(P)-binding domain-containing protein [Actinospica sp.]HWG24560.1 NAD(P)-binding domain-containing protein [Actinospica sp.]